MENFTYEAGSAELRRLCDEQECNDRIADQCFCNSLADTSKVLPAGDNVLEECRNLLKAASTSNCCVICVENKMNGNYLGNPQTLEETGKVQVHPAQVIEPEMGCPVLFCKREFATKGTCGCLSYDVGDTKFMVAVKWHVPARSKGEKGDNVYNALIIPRKEIGSHVSQELEDGMRSYKDGGKFVRKERGIEVQVTLTEEEKALLYIVIRS